MGNLNPYKKTAKHNIDYKKLFENAIIYKIIIYTDCQAYMNISSIVTDPHNLFTDSGYGDLNWSPNL